MGKLVSSRFRACARQARVRGGGLADARECHAVRVLPHSDRAPRAIEYARHVHGQVAREAFWGRCSRGNTDRGKTTYILGTLDYSYWNSIEPACGSIGKIGASSCTTARQIGVAPSEGLQIQTDMRSMSVLGRKQTFSKRPLSAKSGHRKLGKKPCRGGASMRATHAYWTTALCFTLLLRPTQP